MQIDSFKHNNFNAIRLIAAFMVMSGHMAYIIGVGRPTLFENEIQALGCKIFFIIGGCLITQSILRDQSIIIYSIKRISRIFPALIVCILTTIFVFGPLLTSLELKDYLKQPTTYLYLKNIFLDIKYFLPGVFTNNPYPNAVNGSLWTLPIEFTLYFVLFFYISLVKKFNNENKEFWITIFIAFSLCLFQILHLVYYPTARAIVYGTDWISAMDLIPYYFIGSLFVYERIRRLLNIQIAVILIIIMSCFHFSMPVNVFFMHIVLPYIIMSLAFTTTPFFYEKLKKLDISYGIYLYSFLVQQSFIMFLQKYNISIGFSKSLVICLFITCILAKLSDILVEKPTQKLSKKFLTRYKL